MEIYILIGVYGSGKSTILKNIDDFNMDKISLDILDKDSREKEERIRIIYNLFLNFFKIHVKYELFKNEYLKNFYIQNQSLINTLSALYSIYFFKKPNDIIINNLREKILIPSILEYFIDNISSIEEKNVFVDSGAMHFLSMDRVFFEKLYKKFHKINILYINNPTQQIIFNLFRKNNGYFAFLERGFRKEIFKNIEEKFQIIMPSNLFECTSLIEANLDIRNFIEDYIKNIIILSKMRLDTYIYSIDIYKNYVNLTEVNLDLNESIISIVNKIYDIIKTIKGQKMENKLLKEKPKVIFFDLSSTILDSHKIDLECINFVLKKYGMPSWEDGTRLKKDKAKSMKENFPNFFGEEIAEQAYQKYLQLLIDNIGRMPLIPDIEATLNYCRENGIKAVIVSNRDNIFVEKFLDIFGFRKYFDSILTPEVTGYTKPHPMIINQYLLKNSLDPKTDTILFMGDAFADVRSLLNLVVFQYFIPK